MSRCFIMGKIPHSPPTRGPLDLGSHTQPPSQRRGCNLPNVADTGATEFNIGPFKNSSAATMHFYLCNTQGSNFGELHPTCLVWNNVNFFSVNVQQPTNSWVPKASEGMTVHIWLLGMCFWTSTNCVASGAETRQRKKIVSYRPWIWLEQKERLYCGYKG